MANAKRYNIEGKVLGEVSLPETVFGIKPNEHAVWEAVRCFQANQRQGTAATKNRSEVSGGGRKPWRQKGTGRARHGSTRSPIWRGGGVTFGPRPRDYGFRLPKKVRRLALLSAMSQRASEGDVAVIEDWSMDAPKTGTVASFLSSAGFAGRRVCLITGDSEPNVVLSCRNIPGVEVMPRTSMNVYDLIKAEVLVLTDGALEGIKEVYGS